MFDCIFLFSILLKMNSKRKVQFDMTTRVKKITRHSEEYESDEEIEKTEKPKHTLDSDEEDETRMDSHDEQEREQTCARGPAPWPSRRPGRRHL